MKNIRSLKERIKARLNSPKIQICYFNIHLPDLKMVCEAELIIAEQIKISRCIFVGFIFCL